MRLDTIKMMNGAVIGGGIIGMSIAWRLSQKGVAVTVFDAGRVGGEASWAGAGMLAPGGEFETRDQWADFALESLQLYPAYVEELESASSLAIDFRICGAFQIAGTEEEAEALRMRAAQQSECGIWSEQFPPARIPGLREGMVAAQYYPFDAVVNPRDVMRALVGACRNAGVQIREHEPVNNIDVSWPFDFTVIAAGAWSNSIALPAQTLPGAFPVRGHLVAFEEDTGLCDAIVRRGPTYLLRRAGNVIVAGASTELVGFDRSIDSVTAARISDGAGELIPALENRPYIVWNGFRPGSATGEPVLQQVNGTSVWLAYGHYRNGILLAPATAARITDDIMRASSQTGLSAPAGSRQ